MKLMSCWVESDLQHQETIKLTGLFQDYFNSNSIFNDSTKTMGGVKAKQGYHSHGQMWPNIWPNQIAGMVAYHIWILRTVVVELLSQLKSRDTNEELSKQAQNAW